MLRGGIMARTPPRGPVYICLDAGLQETRLNGEVTIPDAARFEPPETPHASADAVAAAAETLIAAERPVMMIGRVSRSREGWDRRVRLAEMLGARVVTDLKTSASFPTGHPLHAGPPSNWVRGPGEDLVRNADALLVLDWIDLAGTFKALGLGYGVPATVIDVTLDSYVHNGWSMDHFGLAVGDRRLLADPDAFVAQLLDAVEERLDGTPKFSGGDPVPLAEPEAKDASSPIAPRDIAGALNAVKGERKITLTRVPLGWAGDSYHFAEPLDYLGNDGGGGLGSGTGNAIGAGLALMGSGRVPVAILGDGDFMQGGSALWTAAHYDIPVLFVGLQQPVQLQRRGAPGGDGEGAQPPGREPLDRPAHRRSGDRPCGVRAFAGRRGGGSGRDRGRVARGAGRGHRRGGERQALPARRGGPAGLQRADGDKGERRGVHRHGELSLPFVTLPKPPAERASTSS